MANYDEKVIRTWILVADAAEARLFLSYPGQQSWFELHSFRHPQSRMKGRELYDSPPPLERGNDEAQERASQDFAHQLGEYLDVHCSRNDYERLVLVAPPSFLGLLRKELTKQVEHRVVDTLNQDLVRLRPKDIQEHIQERVDHH